MQASRGEAARGGGGAAPPDPPSAPPDLPSRPSPAPPQLSNIVADGMRLVSTFSHDELVMAVVTLFPLVYGTLAALRWMSGTPTATAHRHRHDPALSHAVPVRCPRSCAPPAGNTDQSRDDSSDGHRQQHSDAALSCVARQAATAATSSTLNQVRHHRPTNSSLLIAYYSLLTSQLSPLTTYHYSTLTTHHSPLTTHHSPLTTQVTS